MGKSETAALDAPVEIRTARAALEWGDGWVSAYAALEANIEHLENQVFLLKTRAVILEAEALLLRYDIAQALRKVPSDTEPAEA